MGTGPASRTVDIEVRRIDPADEAEVRAWCAPHAAYPQCERIITSNANLNKHMNAIHARMGYCVLEQAIEMQKKL